MEEHGRQHPETVLNRDELLSLMMLINILLVEPQSSKHTILPMHGGPSAFLPVNLLLPTRKGCTEIYSVL